MLTSSGRAVAVAKAKSLNEAAIQAQLSNLRARVSWLERAMQQNTSRDRDRQAAIDEYQRLQKAESLNSRAKFEAFMRARGIEP
jgi:hypothetical protein